MNTKKLWMGFILVMVVSLGIMGWFGREIYREVPPIPERIVGPDGTGFSVIVLLFGIGLMLFVLRDMDLNAVWKERPTRIAFWSINTGLLLKVVLSVLPVGLVKTVASVKHGLWYARSAEFLKTPALETIRWLRVIGDSIFAIGALSLGWFAFGLNGGWSVK